MKIIEWFVKLSKHTFKLQIVLSDEQYIRTMDIQREHELQSIPTVQANNQTLNGRLLVLANVN